MVVPLQATNPGGRIGGEFWIWVDEVKIHRQKKNIDVNLGWIASTKKNYKYKPLKKDVDKVFRNQ